MHRNFNPQLFTFQRSQCELDITSSKASSSSPKAAKAVNKSRSTKKAASTSQCSQDDIKPPYSYIVLIVKAISQSPNKILTCGEICDYIIQQFPYYGKRWPTWQNTIRHTLSLNDCFIKVQREKGSSSSRRSNLWKLHPLSGEMFNNGSSLRRKHCHIHQLPVKSSPTSLDVIHPPPSFPAQSVKQDSLPSSPMEGYAPFVHECVTDQHTKECTRSSRGRISTAPHHTVVGGAIQECAHDESSIPAHIGLTNLEYRGWDTFQKR